MFANVLMFVVLALVMFVVSQEVYAMLKAVEYASKCDVSIGSKCKAAVLRWLWSSIVLHELFMADMEKKPAYRVSVPLFVAFTMFALLTAVTTWSGVVELTAAQALLPSIAVGCGYFAVAYGKAFIAARKDVAQQTEDVTWYVI